MAARQVTREEFDRLCRIAGDTLTKTVQSSLGFYDAVGLVDGQLVRLSIESLNPCAKGEITEITEAQAKALGC